MKQEQPFAVACINDAVAHLRAHLRRHDTIVNRSMRGQLCGVVSHALHHLLRRNLDIHPGIAQMAKWGQCSERQARRNVRTLEAWGVLQPVAYAKGGRRATRYAVDYSALIKALFLLQTNPARGLIEKLREAPKMASQGIISPAENPDINPDTRGDMRGDTMSAGIHSIDRRSPDCVRRAVSAKAKNHGGGHA